MTLNFSAAEYNCFDQIFYLQSFNMTFEILCGSLLLIHPVQNYFKIYQGDFI